MHVLTHSLPVFLLYRNLSLDLKCKSTDCFLLDENIGFKLFKTSSGLSILSGLSGLFTWI